MSIFLSTSDPGGAAAAMGGSGGIASLINAAVLATLNQSRGFVNALRNGAFSVAQRGASGSVSAAASVYTLDGWIVAPTGAALGWAQDTATNAPYTGLKLSAATGITAASLIQRVSSEAMQQTQPASLASPWPLTAQFLIVNNTSASITPKIAAGYASAKNNFATVTADLAATSLQAVAAGASVVVSYTWTPNANCANGYQISLQFGAGLNASSGSVSVFAADLRATPQGTTGLNSNPPVPELRDLADESSRCQGYYFDAAAGGSTAAWFVSGDGLGGVAGAYRLPSIPIPPMLGAPTLTARNQSYTNASALALSALSPASVNVVLDITVTTSNGTCAFNFSASCEL
jgi:hypothetical protein